VGGTSSDSYEWGKKDDSDTWVALGQAIDKNLPEWRYYCNKVDLLTQAMLGEFCAYPSFKEAKTMAIFRVSDFSTGNAQVEVLWTWGEISQESVKALTEAAVELAKKSGAGRIFIPACKVLYKQLMPEGFRASKIQMIKEL
jgi:hypothetical protein